jgi:hypothetical protein
MCFLISEYPSDVLIATFFLCLPVEDILLSDKRVGYIICKSRMIFEQAAAHFEIRRRIVLCVLQDPQALAQLSHLFRLAVESPGGYRRSCSNN